MPKKDDNIVSLQEMGNILGVSFNTAPNSKVKKEKPVKPPKPPKPKKEPRIKTPKEPHYATVITVILLTVIFSITSGAAGAALFSLALTQFFEPASASNTVSVPGESAYDIAVQNGFKGSEKEWLQSLKGEKGNPGIIGTQGLQGLTGEKGDKGDPGEEAEIQNLTSIPGWPVNCSNPKFTQVQIFDKEDVGEFYNILTCD